MTKASPRTNRTICVPFCKKSYERVSRCAKEYRAHLDSIINKHPRLFPAHIRHGYQMKDSYLSRKLNIRIRRIKIGGINYTARPSFVMPYQTAFTDDAEKALFLRKFDVPFWGIAKTFGKSAAYWYRMESHLGRFSIVGTTVHDPEKLPRHLVADEKHTKIQGEKCYIATTVGGGCILGVAVAENADNAALARGYGVFKEEALSLKPDYTAKTVNTDGWTATQNAFRSLFPTICVLCCFLHIYIKIRDRAKKKHRDIFLNVAAALWECFRASTQRSFSQRIRRLVENAERNSYPDAIVKPLQKLQGNIANYSTTYKHPGCHRTSNMLDRLMRKMDQHLYNTHYFHGSQAAAERNIRGWALLKNFTPQHCATAQKHGDLKSPAEQLNGFRYHDSWLQNLLVSASLGGLRQAPLNP